MIIHGNKGKVSEITVHINQYDPTRTTGLRNAFAREMERRFNKLTKLIRYAIVDRHVFSLSPVSHRVPYEGEFAYPRSSVKIEEFMRWLEEQVEKGLLSRADYEQIGRSIDEAWTNMYIYDSYKRGVMRARMEMIAAGMAIPSIEMSGGIEMVMSIPPHLDRVGVLFTRVYNDLKGITSAMDSQISRILAQGMLDGDGPMLLARKIVATINGTGADKLGIYDTLGRFIPGSRRAEILARTEIIRAHHLGTIQEYRNWGLLNIEIQAEWKTAGDDRVCAKCDSLEGKLFTLDEIEPMIPLHPQCRCIALPYVKELEKFYTKPRGGL